MQIRLFSVDSQSVKSTLILRTKVAAAFRPYSRDVIPFSDYLSVADMASPLDLALRKSDMVVIFSSLNSYRETKEMLFKALHIKTEHRFDVYNLALEELGDVDLLSREASVHSELPVGAALFIPKNGLYPGFSIKAGSRYIMFLPYDEKITTEMFNSQIISYLSGISGDSDKKETRALFSHADICEILADAGAQVAIANTPAMDFICGEGARLDGFYRYFRMSKQAQARSKESPKDYVVKLAIYSAREMDCPYGIALSNIFTSNTLEGKELKLYFAVTSRKTASCASLTAQKDEAVDEFLLRAVEELFSLLKKRLFDENPILRRR